jgi:pimeloyl-ACP methyl ester carboxylesterase
MTAGQDGFTHGIAQIADGVKIHHVTAGDGARTMLLIHGFPQSWWEWRDVMPILARAGIRAIAVDYRGAGNSSRPRTGYDKMTMAGDLHSLLHDHLGVTGKVAVVGHDIGGMVASAYALRFRDAVSHLAIVDSCAPGTQAFDALRAHPRPWHLRFHSVPDLPELLVEGKERHYLRFIVENLIADPSKFTADVMDVYARLYEAPGAMRAAFDAYRAMDQDVIDARAKFEADGKLAMPVLALAGGLSPLRIGMHDMIREFALDTRSIEIPGTGHWLAEERPEETAAALLQFVTDGQ